MVSLGIPSTRTASIAVFVCASVWGLYWVPLRVFEAGGVEGGWSVTLLNLPPLVLLVPLMLLQRRSTDTQMRRALLIGIFAGAGLALYASGLVYSTVLRATLLFYLTPVWSTILGMIWLGERVTTGRWAAIVIGLLGMGLLLGGGQGEEIALNIGDLLAFLSGIAWAVAATLIRRFDDVPLAPMATFQFAFTAAIAALVALTFGPAELPARGDALAALPLAAAASVGLILPTVWIIFWAQKFLFPGRAGLLMMSEALVAVITASIFLPEEQMGLVEWIGASMIIAACLIEVAASSVEAPAPADGRGGPA
ncbi:MAG: DMT family transporter [Pseudomonadota bacterium]